MFSWIVDLFYMDGFIRIYENYKISKKKKKKKKKKTIG